MPLVWWRLSSRNERVKVEKLKVWRRRILSCSMTTSRRILKRALSGGGGDLRKDIFAVVDYL